eukprot:TRINITY_DN729_c0_g1_i2.p1 TRINITY_DN729_c0_g1~~TRINITY_DN729_c0_g1_i2.p1  ORF type:complete len:189 (-),score=35.45 TRINITY_DN729_c0_g1_i2:25-516(-)
MSTMKLEPGHPAAMPMPAPEDPALQFPSCNFGTFSGGQLPDFSADAANVDQMGANFDINVNFSTAALGNIDFNNLQGGGSTDFQVVLNEDQSLYPSMTPAEEPEMPLPEPAEISDTSMYQSTNVIALPDFSTAKFNTQFTSKVSKESPAMPKPTATLVAASHA